LQVQLGVDLALETVVEKILQNKSKRETVKDFVGMVLSTREEEERTR